MNELDNGDLSLGREKQAEDERLDAIYAQCEIDAAAQTVLNKRSFIKTMLNDFKRMRDALFQELCGNDEKSDMLRHDCAHLITALIAGGQATDSNIEHVLTMFRFICTRVAVGVAEIEAETVSADQLFEKR